MSDQPQRDPETIGAPGAPAGCYYGAYLKLDRLLSSQSRSAKPWAAAHRRDASLRCIRSLIKLCSTNPARDWTRRRGICQEIRVESPAARPGGHRRPPGCTDPEAPRAPARRRTETMRSRFSRPPRSSLSRPPRASSRSSSARSRRARPVAPRRASSSTGPPSNRKLSTRMKRLTDAGERPNLLDCQIWLSRMPFRGSGRNVVRRRLSGAVVRMLTADAEKVRGRCHLCPSARRRDPCDRIRPEEFLGDLRRRRHGPSWRMSGRGRSRPRFSSTLYRTNLH